MADPTRISSASTMPARQVQFIPSGPTAQTTQITSTSTSASSTPPDKPIPKRKGRPPGRPRIYHPDTTTAAGTTGSLSSTLDGANPAAHSVNEIIPKVWIIANFGLPIATQIAQGVLQKGDKVVLGCSPGGQNEAALLRKAEAMRMKWPDRCIVVELDVR